MRLRGDDFVSYTIICRVCAAGTHTFADVKFPRACRLRRHTLRTEPARCGLRPAGEEGLNCKQHLGAIYNWS